MNSYSKFQFHSINFNSVGRSEPLGEVRQLSKQQVSDFGKGLTPTYRPVQTASLTWSWNLLPVGVAAIMPARMTKSPKCSPFFRSLA